jgi:hypothetical protein
MGDYANEAIKGDNHLTSAVDSVTDNESLMGRINDSFRFPPKNVNKLIDLLFKESKGQKNFYNI